MTSARPNYTQIREEIAAKLKEAERILVVTHQNPDADAIGSGLALTSFMEGMGKQAELFLYGDKPTPLSSNLDFLPLTELIKYQQRLSRDFVIKIDRKESDLTGLRYEATPGGLEIFLSPGAGGIKPESISFEKGQSDFDLIVSLDADSLDRLGQAGSSIREELSDIELINIDHHGTNTRFGGINLVIPGASSTSELVWSLLELIDERAVTPEIATLLLTGIMADTGGLQNSATSQRALEITSRLIGKGADRETIMRKVFREKSLPVLRLWGKILSNLHTEGRSGLAWSSLSFAELREENSDEVDSGGLLGGLLSWVKEAQVVLLLIEREIGRVQVSLRSPGGIDVSRFATEHGGGGHPLAAGFTVEKRSLEDIEHDLIPELISYIRDRQRAAGKTPAPNEPKPASKSGEVVDIFETKKPKKAPAEKPAPVVEAEAELSDDPADYIADETTDIPFSKTEYTAPKERQGEIGVWTPDGE